MKNNHITNFMLVLICSLISGCYDVTTNHQLSIKNESKKQLSILYSNTDANLKNENNIAFYTSDWNTIKPDSSRDIVILGGKDAWHDYIEKSKTKKVFIYLFETDTLKKYDGINSMDDMVNQHKYLKLFSYSEQELDRINWQIKYQ